MSCCRDKGCEVEALQKGQSKVLWTVLGINGGMFAVELVMGLLVGSVALLADSLDMLSDTLVYGFSIFAIGRTVLTEAWRELHPKLCPAGRCRVDACACPASA